MDLLSVRAILFLDIGGYLFPDHPTKDTPPNPEIIDLTNRHCRLWGSLDCFIAANVSERYDLKDERHLAKDRLLLTKFQVFAQTGLIDDDYHFYKCYGPTAKGPELKERARILSNNGYSVLQILCDNSYSVARTASEETHCIILNGKGAEEPENSAWLSGSPRNLHPVTNAHQIACLTAYFHLKFLKDRARAYNFSEPGIIEGLYHDEYRRVLTVMGLDESNLSEDLGRL